jgi:hypothetical protein
MTKLELFQQITPLQVFQKFIPNFKGKDKKYTSPFVENDKTPSLHIYEANGKLLFKSHNSGHQGDCLQFVADLKAINCKTDLPAVIAIIAQEFSLNGFSGKAKNVSISYEKAYTKDFLDYFRQFGIEADTLVKYNVLQVKFHHFISSQGKVCKFDYRASKQVVVCYTVNNNIKIYIPEIKGKQKKSFGFKNQTTADVFGMLQLKKCKSIFLAAGEKDCLVLNANGIPAISFQSENHMPTHNQIVELRKFSNKFYICYDNDDAGINASYKIIQNYHGFVDVELPKNFKDVSEYFISNNKNDFATIVKAAEIKVAQKEVKAEKNKNNEEINEEINYTIFHQAENYLTKNYKFRYNTIKLDIEYCKINDTIFESVNENDLFLELNKKGIKIGIDKLICILKSSFVNRYNPLQEYFKSLPRWDYKTDYIEKLAGHLKSNDSKRLADAFKKWIVRAVKCVMEPGSFNKQAFIIVHSKQNSGKTTFCRFLCPTPLKDYIAENISDDKDSKIAIATNFLINLDELSSLSKYEINSLKSLFSKDVINERLPYDRKNSIIHRVASFIGSTNMAEFLTDETGSVRWLCFEITDIDWRYRNNINIDDVWSEAYTLYKAEYDCNMSKEDIDENEKRNAKFQQLSIECELIPKIFAPTTEDDINGEFLTASDILVKIAAAHPQVRFNKISIGRAMPKCGFHRVKQSSTDRYGYYAITLNPLVTTPKQLP